MNLRPILLVEDNSDDAYFMQRAFESAGVRNEVVLASDGEQAVEYFEGPCATDDTRRPCLVLLDVKLPYRSGLDVLEWLRKESNFKTLPVIMLTSSHEPSDVSRAHELGVNAYVVKPPAYAELTQFVEAVRDFWLKFHRPVV